MRVICVIYHSLLFIFIFLTKVFLTMSKYKTSTLPTLSSLYSAAQCQALDQIAINDFAIPSYDLMNRAANSALDFLRVRWPQANNVVILCGGGNNGGDGLVLARLLKNIGIGVEVFLIVDVKQLKGDALRAYEDAVDVGVKIKSTSDLSVLELSMALSTLVVDAMLGTGTKGELRENILRLVKLLNESDKPVFALDAPTGICSDTGKVLGEAVKAQATLTFIANKQGLLTGAAPDYVGDLHVDRLGLTQEIFEKISSKVKSFSFLDYQKLIIPRSKTNHKGSFGRVLLIGGDQSMGGAIAIAGMAALRVGAGLVHVACHADNAAMVTGIQPELMCSGITKASELDTLIKNASVIALGPGLGQSAWSQMIFAKVIEEKKLKVLDADALNLLAHNHHYSANWVLTPHPGEAGRLLASTAKEVASTAKEVNENRFAASAALQEKYGGVSVLKGAGSIVQSINDCGICLDGNPGMASGGMGDALTGILVGLLAQFENKLSTTEISIAEVVRLAVSLHSHAADCIANIQGERGMLASDLISQLPKLVNAHLVDV
jgi:NAD(P)H-hydrate epimerase